MRVHLGSGTRTGLSDRIKTFGLKGEAVLSPEDGERLNVSEGEAVRISSPHGTITREVRLDKDLKPGLVFIPTAFHDNDAIKLIELTRPGEIDSDGWHGCDVKIESTGGHEDLNGNTT
jgi:formylmethanofuran dehydrogenase subunit D